MTLKTRWKHARDLASHTAYVSGKCHPIQGYFRARTVFPYSRANLSPWITSPEVRELARIFVVGECSWALSSAGIRQVAMRMAIRFTFASNLSGRCSDARTGSASKNASSGVHKDVTHRAAALFHNPANNHGCPDAPSFDERAVVLLSALFTSS
jgi:hypothetical protein